MKGIAILTIALMFVSCQNDSQVIEDIETNDCKVSNDFTQYSKNILSDTSVFKDFGIPPHLTCEILIGLERELDTDSAKFYFEKLERSLYVREGLNYYNLKRAVNYFKTNRLYHCLLATSVNWNPDIRLLALEELYQLQIFKLFAKYSQKGIETHIQMEQSVVKFLIYILENTKWATSGGENLVIQNAYRTNIAKILDFISYGKIHSTSGLQDNDYSITTLKIENWKKRIKE